MRYTGFGQILFGLSFAALGVLTLVFPDFARVWPMVPKWLSPHDPLAMGCAVILLAGGLALLVPPTARVAALVLAIILLVRLLLLKLPPVLAHPLIEGEYEDLAENMTHVAGAWIIFALLSAKGSALASAASVRAGQVFYALALLPFGLSHFFYLNMTAPLIPSWLPFHVPLSYATGAAHFVAGLCILTGVLSRLAAVMEAVMVSLFTIIIWIPVVIAAPAMRGNWSEICVSAAISGAAWVVAESLRDKAWGLSTTRN